MKRNNLNKLILELLNTKTYITIYDLSISLSVSTRSISNYLKEIEPYLSKHHLELVKKTGSGIKINGSSENITLLKSEVLKKYNQINLGSSQDIALHMFYILVIKNTDITIAQLSNKLHISIPSLYKHLDYLEKKINKQDIKIIRKRNQGINIIGDEKIIRGLIFDYILKLRNFIKDNNLEDIKNPPEFMKYATRFDKDKLNEFEDIVYKIEEMTNIQFVPADFQKIVYLMAITKERILASKSVTLPQNTIDSIISNDVYGVKDKIQKKWNEKIFLKLIDVEAYYLTGVLFSSRTLYTSNIENNRSIVKTGIRKLTPHVIANQIISKTYEYFEIENKRNFEEIVRRWFELICFKITYEQSSYNPSLSILNNQFKNMISFLQDISEIIYKEYNYNLSNLELAELAIHIASSIEESKKPLRGCFVYDGSYNNIKFSLHYLENNIKQIELTATISRSHFKNIDISRFDIIIFNYHQNEDYDIPKIIVPPVIGYEHFHDIIREILDIYEKVNQDRLVKNKNNKELMIF